MKAIILLFALSAPALNASAGSGFSVVSPDGRIEIKVSVGDRIRYSVLLRNKALLQDSTLSIDIDHTVIGLKPKVKAAKHHSVAGMIEPAVRQKFARIPEDYNELRLEMEGGYAVVFRAYNEGAAYRIETALPQGEVKVYGEEVSLNFAGDYSVYYPKEESFFSHNERRFMHMPLRGIGPTDIASIPAVVDAAMHPAGSDQAATNPVAGNPVATARGTDGAAAGSATASSVGNGTGSGVGNGTGSGDGSGTGSGSGSDRVDGQGGSDGIKIAIAESDVEDYPGLWLRGNGNNSLSGTFPPYPLKQQLVRDRDFKITEAAQYIAVTRGTRTFPWRLMGIAEHDADLLTNQLVYLLAKPSQVRDTSWIKPGKVAWDWWNFNNIYGVDFKAGINTATYKYYIDFAAKYGLEYIILDEGWYKLGNLLSVGTEGVQGMEHLKWSNLSEPKHNVTIPFTRMFLGPMDYTPGAMLNAAKGSFAAIFQRPMCMGTRCHQLAMYVVYESPLQMLADSPSNYLLRLSEGGGWAARIARIQQAKYQEARRAMWTTFEIVAYGPDRNRLAEAAGAAFEEIDRLDRQMSNFSETSELTYINRNAAREEVIIEKELFDFLKLSLDYSRATGGAFDITVGPLMRAWGFFDGKGRVPGAEELASVMGYVGYQHVHLDERSHTIKFDREGVELDLGGIAKGYAVDKAAQILRESGVTSALITSGGSSICAIGAPPGQAEWRVEVSDPTDRQRHVTSLDLKDQSISTSGCHEKSLTSGGKTYCHIMDPRAGHPIEGILGATIVTKLGVEAEALSKAVMVIGVEKSRNLLRGRKDTRAILYYPQHDGSLGSTRLNFDGDRP